MGSDKFLVYGEDYKRIRDQIAQESLQRNLQTNLNEVSTSKSFPMWHNADWLNFQCSAKL